MLSERVRKSLIKGSAIRRAFEEGQCLAALYGADKVYDLSIGNPAAPAPEEIRRAMREIAEEDALSLHSYMEDAGFREVREAISENLNRRLRKGEFLLERRDDYAAREEGGKNREEQGKEREKQRRNRGKEERRLPFTAENVIMSHGAAGAMNIFFRTVLDPDDEVMVLKPYYPGYTSFIGNCYAKKVEVDCQGEDFQIDFSDLERKITVRTKLLLLNSPNNPSGTVYTAETLRTLAEILRKKEREIGHSIYLLSDEPYRELCYTRERLPFIPSFYENTVIAYSFSKSLSIPGERIGYLLIPAEAEESGELLLGARNSTGALGFVNANAFFQKVAAASLQAKAPLAYYRENLDLLYQALLESGFSCRKPEGAFYLFLRVPDGEEERFLERAKAHRLILVGGSSFGMPGFVRISFCGKKETIEGALPVFRRLALEYGIRKEASGTYR